QLHRRLVGREHRVHRLAEGALVHLGRLHGLDGVELPAHRGREVGGDRLLADAREVFLQRGRLGEEPHHVEPALDERLPAHVLEVLRGDAPERLAQDVGGDPLDRLLPVVRALLVEGRE
ncbi:MAG: hypothetical protein ACK55I_10430, partial [bacterium]